LKNVLVQLESRLGSIGEIVELNDQYMTAMRDIGSSYEVCFTILNSAEFKTLKTDYVTFTILSVEKPALFKEPVQNVNDVLSRAKTLIDKINLCTESIAQASKLR